MRDITAERNNIYELQTYLRELHYDTRGAIPAVNPDGIYGKETADAVLAFQRLHGLPATGTVDNSTWDKIYSEYKEAVKRRQPPRSISPFPDEDGYEISEGEYSDIVTVVQFMLRLLANAYDSIEGLPPEGVYNASTVRDIEMFQKAHRLPVTGRVDKATWNALAEAYDSIVNIKN